MITTLNMERHTPCLIYSTKPVAFWCIDKFQAYDILPHKKHIVGEIYTQRIERENLILRNRLKRLNRKTLGYSKSAEMHDKIIGIFIEQNYLVLMVDKHIEYINNKLNDSHRQVAK